MNDEMLNRLRPYLPTHCRNVRPDALVASLLLDSIDLVELFCGLDAELGVSLTIDEFQSARTVGDLIALINQKSYALR